MHSYWTILFKTFILYLNLCFYFRNFSNCYLPSPIISFLDYFNNFCTLATFIFAIPFLYFSQLSSRSEPLKMLLPCSKSLSGVQLITEERSYLIPQALFLLTSEDFQIPSQQHNVLHCRLCQLSEKHVTKLPRPRHWWLTQPPAPLPSLEGVGLKVPAL